MILIIGGSSFIGVHLVDEFLSRNDKVIVTGRNDKFRNYFESKGVEYFNLDLSNKHDFERLPKIGINAVILLAGLLPANVHLKSGEENAEKYFEINTIGTINVLEYCRKNSISRVIATTSYADVINSWSKERALTEEEPRNYKFTGDHAVYVFSKNAACDVMEYYNQMYGMKNVIFRFPMVLGVGPHGYYSVDGIKKKSGFQIFLDNAMAGKDICIYGDSEISRDVVYVKDVTRAFYNAIYSEEAIGLYNITSGRGLTLKLQAEIMAEVFQNTIKSNIIYKPNLVNNSKSFLFSIEKAKKDFDYYPLYADFKLMMQDYKKDLENKKYNELFHYIDEVK